MFDRETAVRAKGAVLHYVEAEPVGGLALELDNLAGVGRGDGAGEDDRRTAWHARRGRRGTDMRTDALEQTRRGRVRARHLVPGVLGGRLGGEGVAAAAFGLGAGNRRERAPVGARQQRQRLAD